MAINSDTVKKLGRLSRIRLDDEQVEELTPQLQGIVSWVEQLSEVDTDGVEPLREVVDIELKQRKDEVNDGGDPAKVLANAPEEMQDFYVVPKVIEAEEG